MFIAVESEPPYLCKAHELHNEFLDLGQEIYMRCMAKLKKGIKNEWPGFAPGIRAIEAPNWAKNFWIV